MEGEAAYNLTLEWNQDYSNKLLPTVVFQCVVCFIGLVGNILVLLVYTFRMKGSRDDRYFIPILAVFDLVASTMASVFYVFESIYFVDFPSSELCKGMLYTMTATSGLSALLLIAIAVQRYLKICKPHGKQMDEKRRKVCLASVVIFSILYSAPVLLFSGNKEVEGTFNGQNVTGLTCFTGAGNYSTYEAVYYYIIFLLMVTNILTVGFLYIPIGVVIYRHNQLRETRRKRSMDITSTAQFDSISDNQISQSSTKEMARPRTFKQSKINFNMMFFAIVVFYLISYTPTCIFLIISKLSPELWYNISATEMIVYFILQRFYVINHVVNPIIYGYFDMKFRADIVSLCKCSYN
ncbi:neurotensin receptor type 1-like [Ostrea edulis]|uniref:neurotensin receptor type 1-like n=1 Tax=Ostrea edulis TaxID=37623 RepID=UPI0020944131|nr:neurotensin receptor type 1-like [Ostrea edulis]